MGLRGCVCVFSRSVVSSSLQPFGQQPTRLLHPWDFPSKNTGVGCHFLLQGLFQTQGWNHRLLRLCIVGGFFTTEPPFLYNVFTPGGSQSLNGQAVGGQEGVNPVKEEFSCHSSLAPCFCGELREIQDVLHTVWSIMCQFPLSMAMSVSFCVFCH